MPRIVVLGAGSVIFTMRLLQDLIFHRESLKGSSILLVDIDQVKLENVTKLACQVINHAGGDFKIHSTRDRSQALQGADYVIISVEIDRDRLWKLDWEIPRRLGMRHTLGENAGPGGLSHTLRTVPLVMAICRDIERICPQAWVLNLTNPMSRICLAINKYTRLRCIGLCHQIAEGYYIAARLLNRVAPAGPWPDVLQKRQEAQEHLSITAAGLNHFTWMLDVRDRATSQDLYPALREAARQAPPEYVPLSRYLLDVAGLMPASGDSHAGELIGFAHEFVPGTGPDFALLERRRLEFEQLLHACEHGQADVSEWISGHSIERAVDIIAALHGKQDSFELAVNIPNHGCIPNLPDHAIVEVPALVRGSGIHALHVGPLPAFIAQMCSEQIAIQDLAIEAALTGDRRLALQALLLDPVVGSRDTAEQVLNALLTAHAPLLPQFFPA
jgi:alpha-galactosidase